MEGLSGGKLLIAEVMGTAGNTKPSPVINSSNTVAISLDVPVKRAIRVLRDELMNSQIAIPMLLYIAQIRSKILHCTNTNQLKLISYLFDTAQEVLMQFTGDCNESVLDILIYNLLFEFIADFLVAGAKSVQTIAELMPSMSSLLNESGLTLSVAFQLVRPIVRAALQCGDQPSDAPDYLRDWHPFGDTMLSLVRNNLPAQTWDVISPDVLITFWSLGLYDLSCPVSRYEIELARLGEKYSECESKNQGGGAAQNYRSNNLRTQEMNRILDAKRSLTNELEEQRTHVAKLRKILLKRKVSYCLTTHHKDWSKSIEALLQHCVLDRILMSTADAVYSVRFFTLLHDIETPHFSTIAYCYSMITTVSPLLFCATESEATFLGYALSYLLQIIATWKKNEVVFLECAGQKTGFLHPSTAASSSSSSSSTVTPADTAQEMIGVPAGETASDQKMEVVEEVGTTLTGGDDSLVVLSHVSFNDWVAIVDVSESNQIIFREVLIFLTLVINHHSIITTI